jgi:hypothetical protein
MGRERWTTRLTVESCLALDIESFRHSGTVPSSQLGVCGEVVWKTPLGDFLGRLDYATQTTLAGTKIHIHEQVRMLCSQLVEIPEQKIELSTSPTNFGGERYWFLCGCWAQVGRLYLPPREGVFRCRHCYNLIHRSAQRHDQRIYRLARNPAALKAALESEKQSRRLLAVSAYTLQLTWLRKGRFGNRLSKSV